MKPRRRNRRPLVSGASRLNSASTLEGCERIAVEAVRGERVLGSLRLIRSTFNSGEDRGEWSARRRGRRLIEVDGALVCQIVLDPQKRRDPPRGAGFDKLKGKTAAADQGR